MSENQRKPVAVFISNLRTLDDMTGLYPPDWHERVQAARQSPGYISSPPFDIQGRATGYLVLMLRSGEEVIKDPASAAALVLEMTRFAAEDLDGDVIGLGSLTTSITHGGADVADFIDRHGWKLRATHGDSGSAAAIIDVAGKVGYAAPARLAIIGAYGVIGTALSRHYSKLGCPLILCGPRGDKLLELGKTVMAESRLMPTLTTDLGLISSADFVITVTSHVSALLSPANTPPRTVVIDPAVPANVRDDPGWRQDGRDQLIISNASQVRLPGVAVSSAMFGTFDEPDGCPTSYACLGETLANALCGDTDHHVGLIDPAFVVTMSKRFDALGFRHAVPRMFGKDITPRLADR